jgi:hypothetical protein
MHDVVFNRLSRSGRGLSTERVAQIATAIPLVLLGAWLLRAWLRPLTFDDAYMFYRYARNIRDGLGIAWNPDGIPTYGMTGQLWVFFILPLTLIPLTMAHALELASWLTGIAALMTLATVVARHSQSSALRVRSIAFAVVAVPLLLNPVFTYHFKTGMDTMLALWATSAVALFVLEYREAPTQRRAIILGVVSFIAVLSRPDTGLVALGVPALAWLTLPGKRRWGDLVGVSLLPIALIALELLACQAYFHTPLPLSFYTKSLHSYAGFKSVENSVQYAYLATACTLPFLAALAATLRRQNITITLVFLVPAVLTILYLLTVRQIMGFAGRYYIPLLPCVVVPAMLSVDAVPEWGRLQVRRLAWAMIGALAVFGLLRPIELQLEKVYVARVVSTPIPVPTLPVAAREPLPVYTSWSPIIPTLGEVFGALPNGAVVAASEVGYVAAAAPHATIIDLVGLNDTRIGLQGFSMDALLSRAPDLIWFPHDDYTGLRATMFADPRLFTQYIVIADAFNLGIAIRRDSPRRVAVENAVRKAWSRLYPSSYDISQYVVPDDYVPPKNDSKG